MSCGKRGSRRPAPRRTPRARRARAAGGRTVKSLSVTRTAKSDSNRPRAVEALFAAFAETRDEELREELIRRHAKLAEKVARNFLSSGEPFEDIAQEAYIGLVKAVDSFDPSLGIKFSTYATHKISGQIRHYLRDRTSVIRQPGWLHERRRKLARTAEGLRQKLNREPTIAEVAAELGIGEHEVREVARFARCPDGAGRGRAARSQAHPIVARRDRRPARGGEARPARSSQEAEAH